MNGLNPLLDSHFLQEDAPRNLTEIKHLVIGEYSTSYHDGGALVLTVVRARIFTLILFFVSSHLLLIPLTLCIIISSILTYALCLVY